MLLKVNKINTFYDTSHILFDVSFEIGEGEVVCLLGRNGVGKTTTIRSVMGLTPVRNGTILFNDVEITNKKPFEIARMGIGYVPEDRIIFPDLTVRENLEIGMNRQSTGGWNLSRIYEMFPVLETRKNQMGGTLSGGEQQILTTARSLMRNPKVLLLDEPTEGLAPIIVKELERQIRDLKKGKMPILISEQNCAFTLGLSDRAYVLEKGHIRWNGSMKELKVSPEVLKKYLGV